MAYVVPQMPLRAGVYGGDDGVIGALRVAPWCCLAIGRRVTTQGWVVQDGADALAQNVLFPAGTDVRDRFSGGVPDFLEVPLGSGRYYAVQAVFDVGAGFANEHRVVIANKFGDWPVPLPAIGIPAREKGGDAPMPSTVLTRPDLSDMGGG